MEWYRKYHNEAQELLYCRVANEANSSCLAVHTAISYMRDYASRQKERGSIEGWDWKGYAAFFRVPTEQVLAIIDALQEVGFHDGKRLCDWEEKQYETKKSPRLNRNSSAQKSSESEEEEARRKNRERVDRHRQKKKDSSLAREEKSNAAVDENLSENTSLRPLRAHCVTSEDAALSESIALQPVCNNALFTAPQSPISAPTDIKPTVTDTPLKLAEASDYNDESDDLSYGEDYFYVDEEEEEEEEQEESDDDEFAECTSKLQTLRTVTQNLVDTLQRGEIPSFTRTAPPPPPRRSVLPNIEPPLSMHPPIPASFYAEAEQQIAARKQKAAVMKKNPETAGQSVVHVPIDNAAFIADITAYADQVKAELQAKEAVQNSPIGGVVHEPAKPVAVSAKSVEPVYQPLSPATYKPVSQIKVPNIEPIPIPGMQVLLPTAKKKAAPVTTVEASEPVLKPPDETAVPAINSPPISEQLLEIWNDTIGQISGKKVTMLDAFYKKNMRALWKNQLQQNVENWRSYCQRMQQSSFLMGGNDTGWIPALSWALKLDNYSKVTQGDYDNNPYKEKQHGTHAIKSSSPQSLSSDQIKNAFVTAYYRHMSVFSGK